MLGKILRPNTDCVKRDYISTLFTKELLYQGQESEDQQRLAGFRTGSKFSPQQRKKLAKYNAKRMVKPLIKLEEDLIYIMKRV